MSDAASEPAVPIELLIEGGTGLNEPLSADQFVCIIRFVL